MANFVSKYTGAQHDEAVRLTGELNGKVATLSEEKVDKNGVDQVTKDNAEFVQPRPSVNLFNKETMVTLGTWFKWSGGTGAGATVELDSNQWTGAYAAIEIPIYQSGNIAIQMGSGTEQEVKMYSYYFTDENNVATESYGIGVQVAITNGYVLSAPNGAKKLLLALSHYDYNLQAGQELMINYGADVLPWEPYGKRYALDGVDIEDERIAAATSIVGKTSNEVTLMLPEQYALVVGDTFELFYKGIINAVNPDIFDIKITCDKGNAYTKRYVWTPTAEDVGSHVLTAELYGINHNLLHKKSVTLVVKAKASSPAAPLNILCLGDSVTAAGVWPVEFHRRLTASNGTPAGDGMTNINFIGSVASNGVKFEGHGGWSITSYTTSNNGENPFWNAATGQLDFGSYLAKVGASGLDYVYLLIGWNDVAKNREAYLTALNDFIWRMQNEYPSVKVVLLGLQLPARDGLGENYGANGVYADYYGLMQYVFDHEKRNDEMKFRFPMHVSTVSIAGQFDTENNMPTSTRTVNARSTITETYQNNGLHPAEAGYKQIADAVYRDMTHKLQN